MPPKTPVTGSFDRGPRLPYAVIRLMRYRGRFWFAAGGVAVVALLSIIGFAMPWHDEENVQSPADNNLSPLAQLVPGLESGNPFTGTDSDDSSASNQSGGGSSDSNSASGGGQAQRQTGASNPPGSGSGSSGGHEEGGGGSSGEDDDSTPPPTDLFCSSFPLMPSVLPTAANTGVPAGTSLTPSGDRTITVAGTVLDGYDITGRLTINASNVTIKNSRIHSSGSAAGKGIVIGNGVTGTKIMYSEIYTTNGGYIGLEAANTAICGSKLWGWENAMTVGGGMIIQGNYIDRLAGGQANPHFDGIEVYGGGATTRIWGNHIKNTNPSGGWLSDTGAINVTAWYMNISDVDIAGNVIGGGSYTLYVDEQSGYQVTNVTITNNRWYKNSYMWGTHLIRDDTSVTVWSGNKFLEDNATIGK